MNNKVNIINFLRGPSCPRDGADMISPLSENIKLLSSLELPATFLLQYDVLENQEMLNIIKAYGDSFEIGGWLEVVKPLCEAAGEEWRSGHFWDYHPNVGFTMGYTPEVRIKIIDAYMAKFLEVFGYYPQSMGSWMLDAVTLDYLAEKYHVKAACICRDQCGTDGYNIWGGYYNQGYYPCRNNMLCPAQSMNEQINLPVFRMLGSDPIHQYDCGLVDENGEVNPAEWQQVITLEPMEMKDKGYGGSDPGWIDWYFKENFSTRHLGFSYTQSGQENSFPWPAVQKGISYQYNKLKQGLVSGEINVETLSQSGKSFSEKFRLSPTCSMIFPNDWSKENLSSYWYYSRFFRVNFMLQDKKFWIRDMHIFDQYYKERYMNSVETTNSSTYDNLPVMDGYQFSKKGFRAGAYFYNTAGEELAFNSFKDEKNDEQHEQLLISDDGFSVICNEEKLTITSDYDFYIVFNGLKNYKIIGEKKINLTHNDYNYSLKLAQGSFVDTPEGISAKSENLSLIFDFSI